MVSFESSEKILPSWVRSNVQVGHKKILAKCQLHISSRFVDVYDVHDRLSFQAMWFYAVCSISGFKHDRNMAIPCHSIFGIYEYHLISLYIMMP